MVNGSGPYRAGRVAELQVNSDQDFGGGACGPSRAVVLLKEQIARLTQACLAADAVLSSLLAYREQKEG